MPSILVWGDRACFTRPEVEVSYEVPTPSAVRGVFDAIYWHPGIRWIVEKIHVLKPIKFTGFRRNEVTTKFSRPTRELVDSGGFDDIGFDPSDRRTQRSSLILKDVAYVFEARLRGPDQGKHLAIFNRRVERGQCFQRPYLGCREFACDFRPIDMSDAADRAAASRAFGEPSPWSEHRCFRLPEDRDLGFMLYDVYDNDNRVAPRFFHAKLEGGAVDVAAQAKELCR